MRLGVCVFGGLLLLLLSDLGVWADCQDWCLSSFLGNSLWGDLGRSVELNLETQTVTDLFSGGCNLEGLELGL